MLHIYKADTPLSMSDGINLFGIILMNMLLPVSFNNNYEKECRSKKETILHTQRLMCLCL